MKLTISYHADESGMGQDSDKIDGASVGAGHENVVIQGDWEIVVSAPSFGATIGINSILEVSVMVNNHRGWL